MLPARRYPHILCLTANEKDFSLSLEMTIWGNSRILVSQPSPLGKALSIDIVFPTYACIRFDDMG